MSIIEALRTGTRDHHHRLEEHLDLPGRIRTPGDAGAVLAAFLAAWEPLEASLAATPGWGSLGLPADLGTSSPLLRADLGAVGGAELPPAPSPPFGSLPAAVGARYVLLGSALGGQVLAPEIRRVLGPGAPDATRFFRREGRNPGREWRDFRVALAARPWTAAERDEAVASARATFDHIATTAIRCGITPGPPTEAVA
ncbi:biliverdin-producing heme oxygenase [Cryptosporangium arvum]|uniref:Heme oxygenase n=1 Tax=Cryptosporangium arvum DSM 44712 TaxID=927661 RepID=A0A010ZW49_9ACTN|nr:biliverdin-producing heme oxygenase [Cryptosporangium arvum]EXG82894.1 heme oxygenase [Cryptosporangium arvum DSM 44712]